MASRCSALRAAAGSMSRARPVAAVTPRPKVKATRPAISATSGADNPQAVYRRMRTALALSIARPRLWPTAVAMNDAAATRAYGSGR